MVRLLRLLRLFRVPRHINVTSMFEKIEQSLESRGLLFMMHCVYILIITTMFAHWSGCIWFYVGDISRLRFPLKEDGKVQCWFAMVPEADLSPENWHRAWIWSMHYAMVTMTTVGYGDITPQNFYEVVVTLMLCLLSTIVTSVFMGIIMNHVASLYEDSQRRRSKMSELAKYLKWRMVPKALRQAVRRYLTYVWENNYVYPNSNLERIVF